MVFELLRIFRNTVILNKLKTVSLTCCRCISNNTRSMIKLNTKNNYLRTHNCGELDSSNIGQNVLLCGWLEFQRLDRFAVLRDGYGSTQIIVPINEIDIITKLKSTPLESVVSVNGIVEKRPDSQVNKNMATGEIEVHVSDFDILNAASNNLPFLIRNHNKGSEKLRMKYRFLDLRYPDMQKNLRERSKFLMKIRNYLVDNENFVEVETPTLFKKTPGGAQEFVVPTKHPNEFYSLVQSPQQFKQLLMIGGLDKYFQIARCYRDETARPDRQPEFTQLDIEMSFCTEEAVMDVIEKMLAKSWPMPLKIPFQRMNYIDAMKLYGTDQPDISFKCNIFDIGKIDGKLTIKGVHISQACQYFNNEFKNKLFLSLGDNSSDVKVLKFFKDNYEKNDSTLQRIGIDPSDFRSQHHIECGDIVFISVGDEKKVLETLGKCRILFLRWLRSKGISGSWESTEKGKFLWVVNFPLFDVDEDSNLTSVHHPFTSPHPDHLSLLKTNPLSVFGLHYDLILDGYEVGGGSVRIHDHHLQKNILNMLNIPNDSLEHLIKALQSGAPPHAGIALGVDRLVSLMVGAETIREVIAFPKNSEGRDAMSGAPTALSQDDLNHYHINISHKKNSN